MKKILSVESKIDSIQFPKKDKPFFLVLARDKKHVDAKIKELETLGLPYLIVCGEETDGSNIVYRKAIGKYDAINYGYQFVPKEFQIIVLNDVDTKICNFQNALKYFDSGDMDLVFAKVKVNEGPQKSFYVFLDAIRKKLPITASGELMLVKRKVLDSILPLKACKAEDSYILFKALKLNYKTVFCQECYVETERTKTVENEAVYKRKTVGGIYQALRYASPPPLVITFYLFLPICCPVLVILGKKGIFWIKGILHGLIDYVRGDRSGCWETNYMD